MPGFQSGQCESKVCLCEKCSILPQNLIQIPREQEESISGRNIHNGQVASAVSLIYQNLCFPLHGQVTSWVRHHLSPALQCLLRPKSLRKKCPLGAAPLFLKPPGSLDQPLPQKTDRGEGPSCIGDPNCHASV